MNKILLGWMGLVLALTAAAACGEKAPKTDFKANEKNAAPETPQTGKVEGRKTVEGVTAKQVGDGAVNHRKPRSVAGAALRAIKGRDTEGLIALVQEDWMPKARTVWNPDTVNEHRFFKPGTWEQRVTDAWDGKIIDVRRRGRVALVKFAEGTESGEVVHYCVSLLEFSGEWFFKDLDNRPDSDFLRYQRWVKPQTEKR